jgi:hypothetical protein
MPHANMHLRYAASHNAIKPLGGIKTVSSRQKKLDLSRQKHTLERERFETFESDDEVQTELFHPRHRF